MNLFHHPTINYLFLLYIFYSWYKPVVPHYITMRLSLRRPSKRRQMRAALEDMKITSFMTPRNLQRIQNINNYITIS